MRLDKFLSETGKATRRQALSAAKSGMISVNGQIVRDSAIHIDPEKDTVCFAAETVVYRRFVYLMLNKPLGYVSATEDGKLPVVTELLSPELRKRNIFPCGRLDRDTDGLMLLTDDGALSHLLLSPKRHVTKSYRFECAEPLSPDAEAAFSGGMTLSNGDCLKSARLMCDGGRTSGTVFLTEGKYHQIKRMFGALHNRITRLQRITFGPLSLDPSLPQGAFRALTEAEVDALRKAAE